MLGPFARSKISFIHLMWEIGLKQIIHIFITQHNVGFSLRNIFKIYILNYPHHIYWKST